MIIYQNRIMELREKWEFEEMANTLAALAKRELITREEYKKARALLVELAFGRFVLGGE